MLIKLIFDAGSSLKFNFIKILYGHHACIDKFHFQVDAAGVKLIKFLCMIASIFKICRSILEHDWMRPFFISKIIIIFLLRCVQNFGEIVSKKNSMIFCIVQCYCSQIRRKIIVLRATKSNSLIQLICLHYKVSFNY